MVPSESTALDEHEAFEANFSDYIEGELSESDAKALTEHLESCEQCRESFDELKKTMDALSGMHKMSKPQHFEHEVEDTIHRRSAGKFFGKRAFGDRIPISWIAVVALAVMVAVYVMIRMSDTGSLKPFEKDKQGIDPKILEQAKDVVPRR